MQATSDWGGRWGGCQIVQLLAPEQQSRLPHWWSLLPRRPRGREHLPTEEVLISAVSRHAPSQHASLHLLQEGRGGAIWERKPLHSFKWYIVWFYPTWFSGSLMMSVHHSCLTETFLTGWHAKLQVKRTPHNYWVKSKKITWDKIKRLGYKTQKAEI